MGHSSCFALKSLTKPHVLARIRPVSLFGETRDVTRDVTVTLRCVAFSGTPGDSSSFGSCMTALDIGVDITLPAGSTYFFRGWCILLSADYPAAALCCGFKRSTSAAVFCRECYCNQNHADYPKPNSFLDANAHLRCDICLRDREQMAADCAHWKSLKSTQEKEAFATSVGVNTFEHAFVRVPYFDVATYVPYDFMHGELEGTLKNELAAMLYYSTSFVIDLLGASHWRS